MSERHELLRENDLLKERLEQTTKAWTATRNELEDREGRLNKIDREHRERNYMAKSMESSLHSFKESLAHLLCDSYTNVQPTEDAIKEKVRELIGATLERKQVCTCNQVVSFSVSRSVLSLNPCHPVDNS